MHEFEIIIALLLAGAGLTLLSQRLGAPYPAMVALAGAVVALVPGTPTLVLNPELALTLFVAPVLLDAAFDASQRDLKANWRPVVGLALGAVALTVAVVAVVARMLVPGLGWAPAIALGAIVAPPDAAAATAVLKQLKPPHRLMVILEGESLFNDASALLVYRLALGAVVAGGFSASSALPVLIATTLGSAMLGIVLARLFLSVTVRITDVPIAVVIQFCSTFAVWMLAERLHLSGILTVVVYAMALTRRAAATIPARMRIPTFAVWEFAVFVLNVLAFALVGFQLKGIIARLDGPTLLEYGLVALAVTVATIGARLLWVWAASTLDGWRRRRNPNGVFSEPLKPGFAAVIGWAGMRGIVTLAAALALPIESSPGGAFPYRDLILFTSFFVVLGTLVVQGLTLRPLMRRLQLHEDDSVEREVRLARVETLRAAVATLGQPTDEVSELLRRRYELLLRRAETEDAPPPPAQEATTAERTRLLAMREDGTIGDAAFQQLEAELDLEELYLERVAGP